MEINYWWLSLILLVIAILVIWLIKRDRKDEEELEHEIIQSELKPEKHEDDEQAP